MSVSNYTPSSAICKYNYSKLKDVIYLVDKTHVKDIHIDDGEAYIDGLDQLPLRLNGFNISLNEESSLDERYKFTKSVTLSMNGYVNSNIFGGRYYVILESYDGTFWMVNVDFPSRVTYTFNLAQNVYQTDFTFQSQSNFPTLKLNADFEAVEPECLGYNIHGIDSLKLLEKEYCAIDAANKTVYTYGKDFQDIEFIGESCRFEEVYDGDNVTTTISFDIGFDAYKSSWHYNLLEFVENLYSAIVTPNGADNTFFAGFNYGLQPSFTVQTQSDNGASDIITITLIESSSHGSVADKDWDDEHSTETRWAWVKWVDTIKCYECVARARARYLVQQETYPNGTPTGNYKVLEGYENYYTNQGLNVTGTFTDDEEFGTTECGGGDCDVLTNLPLSITYTSQTCFTYSYSATCDWNVSNVPEYISVTPINGLADTLYTLEVCNTKTPVGTEQSAFNVVAGDNTRVVNVMLTTQSGILQPQTINVNCLSQNATFTYDASCPITVISYDQRVTYQITNSQLIVNVPRNPSVENMIDYTISVEDCHGNNQTVHVIQDKTYETWVDTQDYVCESGNSYVKQERYTGTSVTTINVRTGETRKGSLIQSGDTRCSSVQTRWRFDGNYYCIDGNKWQCEEEEITYNAGQTWTKTGNTRLGQMVEEESTWCSETEVQYEWRLTQQSQCGNVSPTPPTPTGDYKWLATYTGGTTSSAECDASSAITSGEVTTTDLVSVSIGDCVTSIANGVFSNCTSLTSVTIPNSVTSIGAYTFSGCTTLASIEIPNSVTYIGEYAFYYCSGLTNVAIPNSVTYIGEWAFSQCLNLSGITIPNSVTNIGECAFYYCSGLTSVTIPSGVTTIGSWTFMRCTSLTSITCIATTPPSLGTYVFDNTNNCPIYVPSASVEAYKSATNWSTYASRIQAIT